MTPVAPQQARKRPLDPNQTEEDRARLRSEALGGRPHLDTRDWLQLVDAIGELRVMEGVDWQHSIGRITEMLQHTDGAPAVLFDDIPDYPSGHRLLVNALSTRARIAVSLGLPADIGVMQLMDEWERRMDACVPVAPEFVASGPITENVLEGDAVDVLKFPTPQWHPNDGGRYIGTGDAVITQDPDDGWINMGTYRVQIQDRNHTSLYISPGKHGRIHRDKYFERKETMPAVVLVGMPPLMFLASCLELPNGVNEIEYLGGVTGRPVPVIKGKHTGLPIPAYAEIALEGFLNPADRRSEGPFGEWTGYYASGARDEPVFEVKAIYHRNDPIELGVPPEKPPYEAHRFQQYLRSANIRRQMRLAGVPDVTGVWAHAVGGCRLFNVVSIKQRYPGHARQAGHIASQCGQGGYLGRFIVVVDDDVDITDVDEVIWAMCTRCDPERDFDLIRRAWSGPLDPAIRPSEKGYNSRVIIDATRPYEWRDEFPQAIGPSPEEKRATRDKWSWIMS